MGEIRFLNLVQLAFLVTFGVFSVIAVTSQVQAGPVYDPTLNHSYGRHLIDGAYYPTCVECIKWSNQDLVDRLSKAGFLR